MTTITPEYVDDQGSSNQLMNPRQQFIQNMVESDDGQSANLSHRNPNLTNIMDSARDRSNEFGRNNTIGDQSQASLALNKQSSYQKMLQKYNEKKEKLQTQKLQQATSGKPSDLPLRAGGRSQQRGASGGQANQPHYLTYLEKTLEKSDMTIQSVRQMSAEIKQLESKVNSLMNIGFDQEDIQNRMKVLEGIQLTQNEENSLNKLILETMQGKIKDQDMLLENIARQLQSIKQADPFEQQKIGQLLHQNNLTLQKAFQNIEDKIEDTVSNKIEMLNYSSDTKNWATREQSLRDMIDNQGKDIAIDMAKIEQQISQMQALLNKRSPLMEQENEQSGPKLSYPTMESIEDRVLELVQQKLQETQIPANINQSPNNKSMSPREVSISYQQDMKYLTNKVDQFE